MDGRKAGKSMKISACVIVKNEAANIGRWLDCVRQIADEIIVVDTGSEDDTAAIAEKGGAKVYHFSWCDDFSAAKNFALEQARGEWIIFLDADEYFTDASIPKLRAYIKKYHPDQRTVGIVCKLFNIDKDRENRFIGTTCQIRVFRNLKNLRYTGAVHERLADLTHTKRKMQLVMDLEIYHTGYSSKIVKQKLLRNRHLLEEKIRMQGEKVEDYPYLMDCAFGLEDYEEAIRYAKKAIDAKVRFIGMESDAYERWIGSLIKLRRPLAEILAVVDEAMQRYPEAVEFPLRKGLLCWDDKDYLLAEECFVKGLAMKDRSIRQVANCMSNNAEVLWPYVYLHLGYLERMRFNDSKAIEYFVEGLHVYPYEEQLLSSLYQCIRGEKPADIIAFINSLYNVKRDAAFLAKVLKKNQSGTVWLYYAQKSGNHVDEAFSYMSGGRFDAAAIEDADRLEALFRLGIVSAEECGVEKTGSPLYAMLPETYRKAWENSASPAGGKKAGDILTGSLLRLRRELKKEAVPMVSIMIPTYNRPGLFQETLKSVCAQHYMPMEILICDNSTNDDTENLMKNFQADARVHYRRNYQAKTKAENFHPFESWAKGDYLQWLMDDDLLAPDKIDKMARALTEHPEVTLVTSRRGIIDGAGRTLPNKYEGILSFSGEYAILDGATVAKLLLSSTLNFIGEPSAVLFRRQDLKNHYWQAQCRGYRVISDIVMWLELLQKGKCLIFRDPLSYYRRHSGQEGQQAGTVLLSRIEWQRLGEEIYSKRIFGYSLPEYQQLCQGLYREYKGDFQLLKPMVSSAAWENYAEAMQKCNQVLCGTGV